MTNHEKAIAMVEHIKRYEYGKDPDQFTREFGSADEAIQEIFFWLEDGACEDDDDINMCVGRYFYHH